MLWHMHSCSAEHRMDRDYRWYTLLSVPLGWHRRRSHGVLGNVFEIHLDQALRFIWYTLYCSLLFFFLLFFFIVVVLFVSQDPSPEQTLLLSRILQNLGEIAWLLLIIAEQPKPPYASLGLRFISNMPLWCSSKRKTFMWCTRCLILFALLSTRASLLRCCLGSVSLGTLQVWWNRQL